MSELNVQIKEVLIKALELEDITRADIEDDAPLFGQLQNSCDCIQNSYLKFV